MLSADVVIGGNARSLQILCLVRKLDDAKHTPTCRMQPNITIPSHRICRLWIIAV